MVIASDFSSSFDYLFLVKIRCIMVELQGFKVEQFPGGVLPYIDCIWVCAAVQGMIFLKPFCQEWGIVNTHFTHLQRPNSETDAILSKHSIQNRCHFVKAQRLIFSIKICYKIYQEQGMLLLLWVKNRVSF